MSDTVLVALLSLTGTLVGAFGGIVTANRLTAYRIERLEEKVNKHNNLIERTCRLEGRMTEAEHRLNDLAHPS